MCTRRVSAAFGVLAAVLLYVPCASAGEPACVTPGLHPVVEWRGDGSARVVFRAATIATEHYVDMQSDAGGAQWAVLPKPAADTTALEYRVVVAGQEVVPTRTVQVTTGCPAAGLTPAQARATGRIVVGAGAGAPQFPAGFQCDGVVGFVDSDGVLVTDSTCGETSVAAALAMPPDALGSTTTSATSNERSKVAPATADANGVTVSSSPANRRGPRPRPRPRPRLPISKSSP